MQRRKPTLQVIPVSEVPRTHLYKILVVDDDAGVANTTAAVLGSAGYECRAVHSAAAIEVASAFVPDLVLSDVMMPDVNGVQVCMCIREQLPRCSILLFSGDVCHARMLMEQAQANFTLLTMPIAPDDLFRQIELLLLQSPPVDEFCSTQPPSQVTSNSGSPVRLKRA